MGTHPIFESDFDCLTECFQGQRNATWQCPVPLLLQRQPSRFTLMENQSVLNQAPLFYEHANRLVSKFHDFVIMNVYPLLETAECVLLKLEKNAKSRCLLCFPSYQGYAN